MICTELSARIDYLNASAEKMTGWSKKEAYGLHINEVFHIVDGATHEPPSENPVYNAVSLDPSLVHAVIYVESRCRLLLFQRKALSVSCRRYQIPLRAMACAIPYIYPKVI